MDRRVTIALLGFVAIVLPVCLTLCHVATIEFPSGRGGLKPGELPDVLKAATTRAAPTTATQTSLP